MSCSDTDIYTIGENESFHYVVYNEDFKKKHVTAGHIHPVLKCKGFVFDVDGRPIPVKNWSSAPFKPAPLASVMKSDSDDSSNED